MLISSEQAPSLPNFESYLEAREYFKNCYGDNFIVLYSGDKTNNQRIYFCYLIANNKRTQSIEISENGEVNIKQIN